MTTLSLGWGGGVPEGVVEGDAVDDVLVSLETLDFFSGEGVPNLAGAVVTPGDEASGRGESVPVAIFVEGAVGEGEDVRLEGFEQFKLLVLFGLDFIDEFWVRGRSYF